MSVAARNAKRAELTSTELAVMPETTNMYRGIGKMFFKQSAPAVIDFLTKKASSEADTVNRLQVSIIS